jgi:hypothetical protein
VLIAVLQENRMSGSWKVTFRWGRTLNMLTK